MRMTALAAAVAVAAASTAAHASTVQLITNGDFTQLSHGVGQITNGANTTATGWSTSGYNFVMTNGGVAVPQGSSSLSLWTAGNGGASTWNGLTQSGTGNFLAMDGDYDTAAVTQTVTGLTVGDSYTLTFDYAFAQQKGFNGATEQHLTVSFGGDSITVPVPNYDLPNHGFSGWMDFSHSFTATSSSQVLSFLAYGNLPVPPFALVSDVSMVAAPEPSTWALMVAGFGGLAAVGFYRRKRAAVAA